MKVSQKTQYSVKVLVYLAMEARGRSHSTGDMANRLGIPRQFLQQIMLSLKAAGVVESRRGLRGGYVLARDPAELTLAAIVQTTQGDLLAPPEPVGLSLKGVDAVLGEVWASIRHRLVSEMAGVTVEAICGRLARQTGPSDYTI